MRRGVRRGEGESGEGKRGESGEKEERRKGEKRGTLNIALK